MSQDSDISWPVLRRIVQEWAGTSAELAEVKPLDGGCISTTVALTLADGAKAVLKISAHRVDRSYQREAHQLGLLREAGVPVPTVHRWKIGSLDDPFSYLLMDYIDGLDWAAGRKAAGPVEFDALQVELAEIVRRMHSNTGPKYGRVEAAGEAAEEYEKWAEFYRSMFEPIWREMEKMPLLGPKERKTVNRLRDRLDRFLVHGDCPRLVHWDLWSSNILARQNGDGRWHVAAVLDPHCKFAHAEAELAYLELFQTVGPAFMKAYQREGKLSEDYHRVRKPVYQLHSLLNHVRLFGEQNAKLLAAALERVGGMV